MLRIQTHLTTDQFPPRTAGYALPGTPYATIIFDAIAEEAKLIDRSQSLVLAHTIAHEVAHLFLPTGYHSLEGIMQPHIDEKAWREADEGSLLFSSDEVEWLRQNVLAHRPK